jgi:hypothetical protein
MTTQHSSLGLLRPFFGTSKDQRGETFTHLNYNGSDYGVALNAGDVDSIKTQPVFQLLLSNNYTDHVTPQLDDYIHQSMIDLIINTAQFHKMIDMGKTSSASGNKWAQWLIDSVYKNWALLTPEVRTFYITHLQILIKNGAGEWTKPIVENGIEIAANLNSENIRLNLTKVDPKNSGSAILFASTLPRIPANIKGLSFTGFDNNVYPISYAGKTVPENLLEDIYTSVYKSNSITFESKTVGVPAFQSFDTNAYPHFNLNVNTFLKNTIAASSAPVVAKPRAITPREATFDDIYESMVTGVQYVRDGEDLFKVVNGQKVKYNEDEELNSLASKSCYGTGLGEKDCVTVFNCLLSGNPASLSRCLSNFANKDMFKVGQAEVEQMPPSVAVQLLKTFGFKPRKELPSMTVLPPTFDDWVVNILPKQVAPATVESIKSNRPLMDYLRGVVSFVRSNPAIIKENKGRNNTQSEYSQHANISVFRQPTGTSTRSTLNASILDLGVLSSGSTANNLPLAALLGNVGFGSSMMLPGMPMQGGGVNPACVNANALSQMFKVTFSEMERNGKQLVDSDKSRIGEAVRKVAQLEEKLMKIIRDLKIFNKLHAALSVKQGPIGVEDVTLAEIHSNNQNSVTGEAVNNLTNCASQNVTELNKLIGDLISRVQRPLVSEVLGGQTGGSMIEVA